ncbi:MAG: hypothetical protein RR136_03550 [Clostridia bacterium]
MNIDIMSLKAWINVDTVHTIYILDKKIKFIKRYKTNKKKVKLIVI